jgi:hypothetical protein
MLNTKTTLLKIGRRSLILIVLLAASVGAHGQATSSQLVPGKTDAELAEQTSPDQADATTAQTTAKPSNTTSQKTTTATPKKPKRGQLIIAPIPIISPTVGRGLVLAVGYVFKLNQEDKKSPPSTVGLVGALTRSGTRGGAVGGRLYFSENKYQTTFVIAKGRVDVDFFGIGRIPGKEAIKVPIRGGGTVFFGEFLRNVWKDIFVGPRYQHR